MSVLGPKHEAQNGLRLELRLRTVKSLKFMTGGVGRTQRGEGGGQGSGGGGGGRGGMFELLGLFGDSRKRRWWFIDTCT